MVRKKVKSLYVPKTNKKFLSLLLLPLPVILASLFIGPSDLVPPDNVLLWLKSRLTLHALPESTEYQMSRIILEDVRLPRILLAFLVGGSLSIAGTALQALFRNPLVSSYILGLQSGAAFGAALALCTHFASVQFSAFIFGLLAVAISFLLARKKGSVSSITLILSGIVVTGVFTALLTIVQFLTDPFKLQTIVHWTMGNLHTATWTKVENTWWMMLAGAAGIWLLRWRLNVLSLGDDETRAVGLHPEREKIMVLLFASLAASAAVSVAGVIGMVGLLIPHMIRMMVGADNQLTAPISFTFGGCFLLVVDNFSRSVTSFEIPIGIFTTLVGGPFFIFLLKRSKLGWNL